VLLGIRSLRAKQLRRLKRESVDEVDRVSDSLTTQGRFELKEIGAEFLELTTSSTAILDGYGRLSVNQARSLKRHSLLACRMMACRVMNQWEFDDPD
jgi:hypothetical protein